MSNPIPDPGYFASKATTALFERLNKLQLALVAADVDQVLTDELTAIGTDLAEEISNTTEELAEAGEQLAIGQL